MIILLPTVYLLSSIVCFPFPQVVIAVSSKTDVLSATQPYTLEQLAALPHNNPVNNVIFTPDSTLLASATTDGLVHIWDVVTLQEIATLEKHNRPISEIVFSPDGTLLATGGLDAAIALWDMTTYAEVKSIVLDSKEEIYDLDFSPDGNFLASVHRNAVIKIWNAATLTQEKSLNISSVGALGQIEFSPNGELLALSNAGGSGEGLSSIQIWNAVTYEELQKYAVGVSPDFAFSPLVAFSPDGNSIASNSGYGDTLVVHNLTDNTELTLGEHGSPINDLVFTSSGTYLISVSGIPYRHEAEPDEDNSVRFWDVATGTEIQIIETAEAVRTVAIDSSDSLMAFGGNEGVVEIWRIMKVDFTQYPALS